MHRRRGARTSKRTATRRTTITVRTQAPRNSTGRWRVRRNSNSLPLFRTQPPMSDSKSDIHTLTVGQKKSNDHPEIRTLAQKFEQTVEVHQDSSLSLRVEEMKDRIGEPDSEFVITADILDYATSDLF